MAVIRPKSSVNKRGVPREIFLCLNRDNEKVFLEKYARHWKVREADVPDDYIVRYRLNSNVKEGNISNPFYYEAYNENELFKLELEEYLNDGNINEYEIRAMILTLIKRVRKVISREVLISVCELFDKSEKIIMRADHRKNSNSCECSVSYKFLIKNYRQILELIRKESAV